MFVIDPSSFVFLSLRLIFFRKLQISILQIISIFPFRKSVICVILLGEIRCLRVKYGDLSDTQVVVSCD